MNPNSTRERFEREQLVKIAAGWRCQSCGVEHGKFHPDAPSVRAFIRVAGNETRCQKCLPDDGEAPR